MEMGLITPTIYPGVLQFGGHATNSEFSKCEVAEFIAFDRVLGASDRLAVEGYLANKWGIAHQLPADHANRDLMAGIGSGISAEITADQSNTGISHSSNCYF